MKSGSLVSSKLLCYLILVKMPKCAGLMFVLRGRGAAADRALGRGKAECKGRGRLSPPTGSFRRSRISSTSAGGAAPRPPFFSLIAFFVSCFCFGVPLPGEGTKTFTIR